MRLRHLLLAALTLSLWLPATAGASFGFLPGTAGFDVAATEQNGAPDLRSGTHPYALDVEAALKTAGGFSEGDLRDLHLALPPGLLVIPTSVAECSATAFHTPRVSPFEESLSGESCPNSSQVGVVAVHSSFAGGATRHFGVFNLTPPFGAAAAIGFAPFGIPIVLSAHVREADAGIDLDLEGLSQALDIDSIHLTIWGTPWFSVHDPERGECLNEQSGGSFGDCLVFGAASAPESLIKSFLTLPTTPCGTPLRYAARATSWQGGADEAGVDSHDSEGHPLSLEKCNEPLSIAQVKLTTDEAAARSGLVFDLAVNDGGGILNPKGTARPAIRKAVVSLPEGLTVNPSLGAGLGTCSEADFAREGLGTPPGGGCPNASKVGDVVAEGMLGLAEPVKGSLYIATPFANPQGSLLALYMVASSPRRGIFLRGSGKLDPDPRTGRLIATFEDLPRLLYTHFQLALREGQRSTMVSPPACGIYPSRVEMSSWAEPSAVAHENTSFAINRGEGGGACPGGGARPFHPALEAGSLNAQAGAFTPFLLHMTRTDSEQEITSYSATLPPGFLGKVAGIPFCPEAALAAAKSKSGAEEAAHPSCPAASKIGRTLAGYGVGGVLAYAPGSLYLAGPYHGSTFSIVALDSALVGPFDLGTVIVRSAIRVDAARAQVSIDSAGSDPIPHILAGIPIHLRDIRVYMDRPGFTFNPTSCDPLAVSSRLTGAGLDPFSLADDSAATSSQRFQVANCSALGFAPPIGLRLVGGATLGDHPSLHVTVTPHAGDANFKAATVTLPPSLFLAQARFGTICTLPQSRANACPARSIYGQARLSTPLLDAPLEGPVYLRSSHNKLPDVVIGLHGFGIDLDLPGRIDSSHGGIRARFEDLPDAPFSRFELRMKGGKHGILVNSEDICSSTRRAVARFIAQDNATEALAPKLGAKCHQKKRKRS